MKCSSCGRKFSADTAFCPFCGVELPSDRIQMFRKIGTAWFIGSVTGLILGAIIGHANSDGYMDETYFGLSLGYLLGGILGSGICIATLAHKGRGVAIAAGYFLCSMIGGTFVNMVGDILFPQHIVFDQNMIPVKMSDTQITVTTVLGCLLGWWILLRIGTHSFKKGKLAKVVIAIVVLAVVAGLILWKTGMLSTPEERMKSVWGEIQEIENAYSGEGPYAVYEKIAKLNLRGTPPEFVQEVSIYANALCKMANLKYQADREGWLDTVVNVLWGEFKRCDNEYAHCISVAQKARKNIYIMAEAGNSYNNALNLWKEERYEEALAEGKKAAELGSPQAVYFLAQAYLFGPEAIQSPTSAYQYSKLLADAEYPDGNYLLGICYHRGIGCEKDASASFMHLRKAVENRHAEAEYMLGLMYLAECGVERNDNSRQEGMRLLSLAAKDGCEEAETFLKNPVDANNPFLQPPAAEE